VLRGLALTAVMARGATAQQLDTVVTKGRVDNLVGVAASANQGTFGAADLALRPLLRPGEIVENVPGVIVTQHSGSGKANQYFLRGFNLDHGTDLALGVDGVPVNMPSHAHGQGYADLNFVIPELIERVDFRKGPYYADVGDFGSAGAFDIRYYDRLPTGVLRVDGGQVGYARVVAADNVGLGSGNLIYAGEFEHNDGPWNIPDSEHKYDGMLRYTLGGLTVTAMAYHNDWHATDQVPDRAIAEGLIDRWGEIDSTDGGNTNRYALDAVWRAVGAHSATRIAVYGIHYDLNLFSNFTYFLVDTVHGDQIEQRDNRWVTGGAATHSVFGTVFGAPTRTTVGLQVRDDDIFNGLYHTEARVRLNAVTVNGIRQTSASPFAENQTDWTSWLRTIVGVRGDFVWFGVHDISGGNAGAAQGSLFSPKASVIVRPWTTTEFYLDGGYGYHSNDARGIVSHVDPATALARSMGAEVGARTTVVPGLQSSVSLWVLDLQSELVWDADVGTTVPSGPTRRYGVEVGNYYTPTPWLTLDADYAWSEARFTDHEDSGQYVPEALAATVDGGIAVHDVDWLAGLRLRYFGPRALTQNDSVRSKATTLVYAEVAYALTRRLRVGVDVFNLLNTVASDIDYYYVSRLHGEPAAGVADIHTHPAEPRELRGTATLTF
jgi:TonB-dependent Receptor Plug Domain